MIKSYLLVKTMTPGITLFTNFSNCSSSEQVVQDLWQKLSLGEWQVGQTKWEFVQFQQIFIIILIRDIPVSQCQILDNRNQPYIKTIKKNQKSHIIIFINQNKISLIFKKPYTNFYLLVIYLQPDLIFLILLNQITTKNNESSTIQ
ncbi:unnamed protein product [Paramecium octaurelia]|uniref:Transmembrane protein n=1 Tax=Paramecium octaurelia TaxID=43137 RepID=A0A8S1X0L1_PAROT|nr:unnamed protein product [Paramecium octaurelia]